LLKHHLQLVHRMCLHLSATRRKSSREWFK